MLKAELRKRLDVALALLQRAKQEPGISRSLGQEIGNFVEESREARKAASLEPSRFLWRIAWIENPNTLRENVLEIRKDGGLLPSDVKRTGIEHAKEWIEVEASSRVEALGRIEAGEGTRYERRRGRVRRVEVSE